MIFQSNIVGNLTKTKLENSPAVRKAQVCNAFLYSLDTVTTAGSLAQDKQVIHIQEVYKNKTIFLRHTKVIKQIRIEIILKVKLCPHPRPCVQLLVATISIIKLSI